LECEICTAPGLECNSWTKTCDANQDTCVTFQTEVIKAPVSFTFISKSCGTSDTCALNYVQTSPHNKLTHKSQRTCCTGEECKTLPPPVLEHKVNQPDGLQCPGCFGLSTKDCTEHLVSCRGPENQCLSITGKEFGFIFRALSYKGCATESLCSLFEKRFWNVLEDVEVDFKCTPALPKSSQ
uniref:Phospholipase A2 inhibitor gamma subunit B n=1 Tax=Laticauda semifasciata TaxID=8631 RepID=PLIGB_LATSE|nr:RecName: Full=Phospholipase A2 inhibitor gamma subunit B; AltName: Full=LsPLI-gamma B; Short=PLI-gamma B; AltName: Full=gamma-PLI B [Laticauda semifasciata]